MVNYKVNSSGDHQVFVVTEAYRKLYDMFKSLKTRKGRIIHVLGAPGTGKSANIYETINGLDLNVYHAILLMDHVKKSSGEVFKEFFNTLKVDMKVKSNEELYEKASEYDAVLFADKFHDSHFLDENKVGFSMWMDYMGVKTFPFYLLVIVEYLKHRSELKKVNIVFQTAWTIRIRGVKHDLFTDFGLLSKLLIGILKLFFEVVEISYRESEIIEIVKKRLPDVDEERVKPCTRKYGSKIRFILEALEENGSC
jgi:hypothetical protein